MNRPEDRLLEREARTVGLLIVLYCRRFHRGERPPGREALCPACGELLSYAQTRIERCPHGVRKPVCAHCRIHCYRPQMRERIRPVMRYAGPRLLLTHPVLAGPGLTVAPVPARSSRSSRALRAA